MPGLLASNPFQFIREFAGALDKDSVFETTADRLAYLSSPRRYPGQMVVDLEENSGEGALFFLNGSADEWISVGGGDVSGGPQQIEYIGDDTYNISAGALLEYIFVVPSSTLSGFKIGITNGGEEIVPAMEVTTSGVMLSILRHSIAGETLYFGGITSNTIIKFYKR